MKTCTDKTHNKSVISIPPFLCRASLHSTSDPKKSTDRWPTQVIPLHFLLIFYLPNKIGVYTFVYLFRICPEYVFMGLILYVSFFQYYPSQCFYLILLHIMKHPVLSIHSCQLMIISLFIFQHPHIFFHTFVTYVYSWKVFWTKSEDWYLWNRGFSYCPSPWLHIFKFYASSAKIYLNTNTSCVAV